MAQTTARRRASRPPSRRAFLRLAALGATGLLSPGRARGQPARPNPDPTDLTLFLAGDVMTGRAIDQVLPHPNDPRMCSRRTKSALSYLALAEAASGPIPRPVAFDYVWGDALAELARVAPDLRIVNLETSVTSSEDCIPKYVNYRMHPKNVPCLSAAGIDCCALANNHVLDWGYGGLLETLDTLRAAGIRTAGAGRDIRQALTPAVLPAPGKGRVIVIAFGMTDSFIPPGWAARPDRPGVNLLPDLSDRMAELIGELVRRAKQPRDVVVLSIHWGGNWGYAIPAAQTAFARRLIDRADVDIVHGHSAHHVKAIEVYRNKLILYGCGDFLNDYEGVAGQETYRPDLALAYFPTIDPASGELVRLRMTPFRIRNFRLNRATPEDAAWLAGLLTREGARFGAGAALEPDNTLSLRWG